MTKTVTLAPPLGALDAEIEIPGSKSYTNRALVMASLCRGESRLTRASLSNDSNALMQALQKFGVAIVQNGDEVVVRCEQGALTPYCGTIDIGPAGTTMRFLVSICAATEGCEIELRGSARMHERPIRDLVDALVSIGAHIDYLGKPGCPPLRIHGKALRGGKLTVSGATSSQFISSLLLASPLFRNGLEISVHGDQISKSYIDMTIDSMGTFGVPVENGAYESYRVAPGSYYRARAYQVEGDASGASYLWGIAALAPGRVRVTNINPRSAQGDIRFPKLLEQMGCKVVENQSECWIEVFGTNDLRAITCDMTLMPDSAQSLAIIAACARGRSTISGLKTLRIKETDRIAAMQTELGKASITTESSQEQLSVVGGEPHVATFASYDDHRMAMSFAMLGARINGITIEHPEVVDKSFPQFWATLRAMGISVTTAHLQ